MDDARILIVEDDRNIADTLKLGLSENGFAVEVAYDGECGRQLARERSFTAECY